MDKRLIPTIYARHAFVKASLERITTGGPVHRILNVGCGDGDLEPLLSLYATEVFSCDVVESDLRLAAQRTTLPKNLHIFCADGLTLPVATEQFDLVVCCEVIEHVEDSHKLLREFRRVLLPHGRLILTHPIISFPFVYDPLHWLWHRLRGSDKSEFLLSLGAYAFGHRHLETPDEVLEKLLASGLTVDHRCGLGGALIATCEAYWVGFAQRLLKPNSANRKTMRHELTAVRPKPIRLDNPWLVATRVLHEVDHRFFASAKAHVGIGWLLRHSDAGAPGSPVEADAKN